MADGKTPRSHLACLTLRGIREGRVPRQRHGHDGAVVRAVAARRPRRSRSNRRTTCADRRTHGGQSPADDPRARQSQLSRATSSDMPRARRAVRRSCAWKTYTQWGPDGKRLLPGRRDRHPLRRGSAQARRQGHLRAQGPAASAESPTSTASARDIGPIAQAIPGRQLPRLPLGLRHRRSRKGLRPGTRAATASTRSIRSLEDNGIEPGSNVYAELGSTWRFLMRDPEQAAHGLGKLLKHCGPDNVLWGTDSHLVRLAAGPDPGLPRVPDRAGVPREVRLPGDHAASCARRSSG